MRLPERSFMGTHGNGQLEGLDGFGQECGLGLVDEEMYVLGHDDIPRDDKQIAEADEFQRIFKKLHGGDG